MSATAAQKVRLGIFLGTAGAIVAATLIGMIGLAAFEDRDEYTVFFEGSVSGLSPGSPVRLNGIDVGRVERVRIDPSSPARVEVTISLIDDTPVREDSVASLNLQGITGLKFIELTGGSDGAKQAEPGSVLQSSRSALDDLTTRAQSIALKVELLLDNLVATTSGPNQERFSKILADVEQMMGSVRSIAANLDTLLAENKDRVASVIEAAKVAVDDVTGFTRDARGSLGELTGLVKDARGTFQTTRTAIERAQRWIETLDGATRAARARLSKDELGKAIASFTQLTDRSTAFMGTADVTLIRAREDILRALDSIIEGAESFAELASLLREDPAALIRGRGGKERELP